MPNLLTFTSALETGTLQEGAPLEGPPQDGPPPEDAPTGGGLFSLMPFVLIGVVFWMLLIAPERKNRKRRAQMLSTLAKDDKVLTNGGIYGRVARIEDEVVTLVVADGVRLRFSRGSIQGLVEEPKGSEEKPS